MPKKLPLSKSTIHRPLPTGLSTVEELDGHLREVKGAMLRLGYVLSRHYRKTDPERKTFTSIETLFGDFTKSIRSATKSSPAS
jgi:hypothetical protein